MSTWYVMAWYNTISVFSHLYPLFYDLYFNNIMGEKLNTLEVAQLCLSALISYYPPNLTLHVHP